MNDFQKKYVGNVVSWALKGGFENAFVYKRGVYEEIYIVIFGEFLIWIYLDAAQVDFLGEEYRYEWQDYDSLDLMMDDVFLFLKDKMAK